MHLDMFGLEVSLAMLALGLLIVRVGIGLILTAHGAQKLFGWFGGPGMTGWTGAMTRMRIRPATPWAWASALAEFLGGIGLAVGLLFPLPSAAIAGSMLVAMIIVHLPRGFFVSKGGYEFNLAILSAVVALALTGPGAYSLDAGLGIRFPEPISVIIVAVLAIAGVAVALLTRAPQPAAETKPEAT